MIEQEEHSQTWISKCSRIERLYPEVDWGRSWEYMNMRGLGSEKMTFIFRMLHNLLPVNIRLFRMNLSATPTCQLCKHGHVEDIPHAVLECTFNSAINDWIVAVLYDIDTSLLDHPVTSLNLSTFNLPISHDGKFPVIWFIAAVLMIVWKSRCEKKPITIPKLRSLLLAELELMKLLQ